jgi:hypothetical protein
MVIFVVAIPNTIPCERCPLNGPQQVGMPEISSNAVSWELWCQIRGLGTTRPDGSVNSAASVRFNPPQERGTVNWASAAGQFNEWVEPPLPTEPFGRQTGEAPEFSDHMGLIGISHLCSHLSPVDIVTRVCVGQCRLEPSEPAIHLRSHSDILVEGTSEMLPGYPRCFGESLNGRLSPSMDDPRCHS